MSKVCRTCLSKTKKFKNIFNDNICYMLNLTTDLKISSFDGLSEIICLKCTKTVKNFFEFRKNCHESNEFLKSMQNKETKYLDDKSNVSDAIKLEECNNDTKEVYEEYRIKEECEENGIKKELSLDYGSEVENENNIENNSQNSNHSESDFQIDNCSDDNGSDKSENEEEKLICNVCKKHLDSKKILKRHLESHNSENPRKHVCDICFDAFHFNNKLLLHKRLHSNEKRYKCEKCSEQFFQLNSLVRHLKQIHKTKKNLKCQKCPKEFLLQRQLDHHLKLKHGIFKKVTCSQCNESFTTNCALRQHENKHTQFPCTMCDSKFSTKYILKAHLLKHTGDEVKVVCNICGKQYDPYYMPKHLKFHANDKPFKCSVCHKSFLTKSKLKYHTRTHTGEKPYMCTVCGNHFTCTSTLKSHMLIHTGEKPFSCKICARQFRQRSCLRTHMKIHTSD